MLRKLVIIAFVGIASLAYSVSSAGAVLPGQMCGGSAGIPCDNELWCEMQSGHCQRAAAAGVCSAIPRVCNRIFKPVCGCDGRTYSNDCERRSHRASKKRDGAC
jgi:hypothetical protein